MSEIYPCQGLYIIRYLFTIYPPYGIIRLIINKSRIL